MMNLKSVVNYYDKEYLKYQQEQMNLIGLRYERDQIIKTLRDLNLKSILDLGAGSGFWLDLYYDTVQNYCAIERSKNGCDAIEEKFKSKIKNLKIVNGSFFEVDFKTFQIYDTLIFSFIISHFSNNTISNLIMKIRKDVEIKKIIVIDSIWSPLRKKKYDTNKLEIRERDLADNHKISIPKRFIDKNDLDVISKNINCSNKILFEGEYWFIALLEKI